MALRSLDCAGVRNVVVGNHVPELAALIDDLELADLIDVVITSAIVGAEKPHLAIFDAARAASVPDALIWMVGDNPVADIEGARGAGVPGCRASWSAERAASPLAMPPA